MEHELEMAIKRITMLMQTSYLPRHLMADLQTLMNAATAWQTDKDKTPIGSTRWR
jgi:hypothetical protein